MLEVTIDSFYATPILDSRCRPTIEVTMSADGVSVTASVPSGKSSGSREACERRDSDGEGVSIVIDTVASVIAPQLQNRCFTSPLDIDHLLLEIDATQDKSNLGANTILATSIAATKLFAKLSNKPVWQYIAELNDFTPGRPHIYMNMLNGGAHADFVLPFQEYILIFDNEDLKTSYNQAHELFNKLGSILAQSKYHSRHGDEGGYTPQIDHLDEPFEILEQVISGVENVEIGIDAAASEFFESGKYSMMGETYSTQQMAEQYVELTKKFRLTSIEDPFHEDDGVSFSALTEQVSKDVKIVGDDLTVTNPKILADLIKTKAGNALIIKPNQIGTLKEVYETVKLAKAAGWDLIASHRSGETEDDFIADLAVGIGAFGLKAGAPTQRERMTKYERLMEIEDELSGKKLEGIDEIAALRVAFDLLNVHVVVTDTKGHIIYANRAAETNTGFSVDEMLGKTPGELWGGNMPDEFFQDMWKRIGEEKKNYVGKVRNKMKNGQEYWQQLYITPILNEEGQVKYYIGLEPDITSEENERLDLIEHLIRREVRMADLKEQIGSD